MKSARLNTKPIVPPARTGQAIREGVPPERVDHPRRGVPNWRDEVRGLQEAENRPSRAARAVAVPVNRSIPEFPSSGTFRICDGIFRFAPRNRPVSVCRCKTDGTWNRFRPGSPALWNPWEFPPRMRIGSPSDGIPDVSLPSSGIFLLKGIAELCKLQTIICFRIYSSRLLHCPAGQKACVHSRSGAPSGLPPYSGSSPRDDGSGAERRSAAFPTPGDRAGPTE